MRTIPYATILILAAGLAPSSLLAQPLAPLSRTDTRIQSDRSEQAAAPRTLGFRGEYASMRDELEHYPVGVGLATPGVFAMPTSTTLPDGFDWGQNNLRGQSVGESVRVVDLAGFPVGGNATQAIRIRTASAVNPGSFYAGASLRWNTPLAPTTEHDARVSSDLYISSIAEQYSFEPVSGVTGYIAGRVLWGGTCVDTGSQDCNDLGLPHGPIPTIYTLTDNGFLFFPVFHPARFCTTTSGVTIPGCTPPAGAAIGDAVPPPIGAWSRFIAEISLDARATFSIDYLNGEPEVAITSHPAITARIDQIQWNSSYQSQDAFMLVDNIEASGPLSPLAKAPPLECPYLDDVEWLEPGPVIGQSRRWGWFFSTVSQLIVLPGGAQGNVLSQTSVITDNQHRQDYYTELPPGNATLSNDLVVEFDARFTGDAVRAFVIANGFDPVARLFRGNEDRSVPGSPGYTPSVFVQTDLNFSPLDFGNSDFAQPVVGVHIEDTGFAIPDNQYATISMRVSANGALRIDVDGQRVYAGPAARTPASVNQLTLESENNAAAPNAELRLDNVAMSCDAPSCATDFDFDDLTTFADLNAVLSNFGASGLTGFTPGDANADGEVNFTDLNAVLAAFGTSCQ